MLYELNIIQDNLSRLRGNLWWTRWQWNRLFSEDFGCSLSVSFHHGTTLISIYTLLLPDGQTGEAWEPPKKSDVLSDFGGRWTERNFPTQSLKA